jgi:hypothetical protein
MVKDTMTLMKMRLWIGFREKKIVVISWLGLGIFVEDARWVVSWVLS